MKRLAEDACSMELNRTEYRDTSIGVISSGIPYQYVREALPEASVLKLGMVNPLPERSDKGICFQSREIIYCRGIRAGHRRTGTFLGN